MRGLPYSWYLWTLHDSDNAIRLSHKRQPRCAVRLSFTSTTAKAFLRMLRFTSWLIAWGNRRRAKRRTKSENVSVEFKDETDGETRGMFVAEADTYGADKLWVVLKPIPIELDEEGSSDSPAPSLPVTPPKS